MSRTAQKAATRRAAASVRIEPPTVTILALDPSTDITGAVIVLYINGNRRFTTARAWDAMNAPELGTAARRDTFEARMLRITWTRQQLEKLLQNDRGENVYQIDLVAYETDTNRYFAPSEALKMAAGAYMSVPAISGLPMMPLSRQAACVASGTLPIYCQAAGRTEEEKQAKKARLKGAVLDWAFRLHGEYWLPVGEEYRPGNEAIADALAIAEAAYLQHCYNLQTAALKKMEQDATRAAKKAQQGASNAR